MNFGLIGPYSNLKDFIRTYDDALDSSVCDLIISEYQDNYGVTKKSATVDSDGNSKEDDHRNSLEVFLSHESVININREVRKEIDQKIFSACSELFQKYIEEVTPWIAAREDSGYSLLIYKKGHYFKEHVDILRYVTRNDSDWIHVSQSKPRQISMSLQLNEDYEGGDLTFFDGSYSIPKKRGSLTLFPSYSLFPHQVCEVTSGVRYSIVSWFS